MREVGELIGEVLHHIADDLALAAVRQRVEALTAAIPAVLLEAGYGSSLKMPPPLHIVIDARRVRDFGIGTHIRSLVAALGAIDSTQSVHTSIVGPDDVTSLIGLPENFRTSVYARYDLSYAEPCCSRCICAAWRPTWCTFRSTAFPTAAVIQLYRGDGSRSVIAVLRAAGIVGDAYATPRQYRLKARSSRNGRAG